MRRFVTLIAILFTFASIMGATVAHAHRYVATPIVVLNHVDAANKSIPVVVQIQQGQIDLGHGLVMPCGNNHAIAVTLPDLSAAPRCETPVATEALFDVAWPVGRLLRPPISA